MGISSWIDDYPVMLSEAKHLSGGDSGSISPGSGENEILRYAQNDGEERLSDFD
jgi:hypothetical protein